MRDQVVSWADEAAALLLNRGEMCLVPLSVSLSPTGLLSRSLNVCRVFCAWVKDQALSIGCFLVSAIIVHNQINRN